MALITIDQIQPFPQANGYSETGTTLRVWYSRNFQASDTTDVQGGGSGTAGFYKSIACTVSSGNITCPAFQIQTTIDANDPAPQSIQCFARFFSNNSPRDDLMSGSGTPNGWIIYNPAPSTTITFAALQLLNQAAYIANPPQTYLTSSETLALIEQVAGNFDFASVSNAGITRLSIAPASAIIPIARGVNDPAFAVGLNLTTTPLSTAPAYTDLIGSNIAYGNLATGQRMQISHGVVPGAPVTVAQPTVKITRYENLTTVNPANNEANAALSVIALNVPGSLQQVCAINANVKGESNGDTLAGNFQAWQESGTGGAEAIYAEGRTSSATGRAIAAEFKFVNLTTSDLSAYSVTQSSPLPNGFPSITGIMGMSSSTLDAGNKVGPAILMGAQGSCQFAAGWVLQDVSVANYVIDDNSNATTGWHVTGTHTNLVLAGPNAGKFILGSLTPAYPTQMYVQSAANGQATFASSGAFGGGITLVNLTAGQEAVMRLNEGGTAKWKTGKDSANNFVVFDETNSRNVLVATAAGVLTLQPTAGDIVIGTSQTPASAAAAGSAGMIRWDSNFIYIATGTNTWKRVSINTW